MVSRFISAIYRDEAGMFWLGSDSGLYHYDLAAGVGLSNDLITDLLLDHEVQLWVATVGGLARLNPEGRSFTRHPAGGNGPPDDRVIALYQDSSGRLWVGTEGGLALHAQRALLDSDAGAAGSFRQFRHDPADPRSLGSDTV